MVVAEALWPSNWPLPACGSYERVSWADLALGNEVYLLCLLPPDNGTIKGTFAKGPYEVSDVSRRRLTLGLEGSGPVEVQEPSDSRLLKRSEK